MVVVFAVVARDVPKVSVLLALGVVVATLVASNEIGSEMEVCEATVLVKENVWSFKCHKHVRGPVVIRYRVAVWLNGREQEVPRLAVGAEEVRAENRRGAVFPLVVVVGMVDDVPVPCDGDQF